MLKVCPGNPRPLFNVGIAQNIVKVAKYIRSYLSLVIHHMADFEALIQRVF